MTGFRYELQTYDTPDGQVGTRVYYPDQRKTVDLGVVAEENLAAAIIGAHDLPGPREVREWDAQQEARRAQDAGETDLEDTVAGWFRDGKA